MVVDGRKGKPTGELGGSESEACQCKVKYFPNLHVPVIVNARGRQGASTAPSGVRGRGVDRRGSGGMALLSPESS